MLRCERKIALEASAIGAMVGVAFGCAWGLAGAAALRSPWRAWTGGLSVAVSAILIGALAVSPTKHPSGVFRGSVYGTAVAGEAMAIFLGVWLLRRFGLSGFLLPVIGFIVGLHFLGLWKATDLSLFLWTALAMCAVCVLAAFLPSPGGAGSVNARAVVTGLGCALVLWSAALAVLL